MLVDADLQDPSELLGKMMELMDAGADVVYGTRTSRAGEGWFKRASAALFYRLNRVISIPIPNNLGDFRLMSRRVVDILLAMPERGRFIRGMVSWIGGEQVPLYYDRAPRRSGKSKYSLIKMLDLAVDAVTSFSLVPLRLAFWSGLFVAFLTVLFVAYALSVWWLGRTVPGWTSLTIALCLFSSLQLIVLGIIGEYVGRLLRESQARPLYVIDTMLFSRQIGTVPVEFSRLCPADRRRFLQGLGGEASLGGKLPGGDEAHDLPKV